MAARDSSLNGTPRRTSSSSSSSSSKKRHRNEDDYRDEVSRSKRDRQAVSGGQQVSGCASPPSVAGPSHVNTETADRPGAGLATTEQLDRLGDVISGLITRLENPGTSAPQGDTSDFSGFHDLSASETDEPEVPAQLPPDPLEDLDTFGAAPPPDLDSAGDNDHDFLKALDDLSHHFHGEEEKGDPLSARLADILNVSLRRRPTSEGIRNTCAKIKLPSNVPNLSVPATNPAISKALSVGGKLIDARLSQANSLLCKALVPVAVCISDIGERKDKPVRSYLDVLNNCLRLLTSAVNYLNHLRKEVARIHVGDSALAELCKWDCEVGESDLFPFDVSKRCDEIHKTRWFGRPPSRPFRTAGPRKMTPYRFPPRRPAYPPPARARPSKPFLGQRRPQGTGAHARRNQQ